MKELKKDPETDTHPGSPQMRDFGIVRAGEQMMTLCQRIHNFQRPNAVRPTL
jgi:hypothetical protein